MADWQAIKTEYITTDTSYRKLAEKYGIHYQAICQRSKAEGWIAQREQYKNDTITKIININSDQEVNRAQRIQSVSDKMLTKIEAMVDGIKTAKDIRSLTAAIKDLKEIQGLNKSDLDRQEQEARIANLRKQQVDKNDSDTPDVIEVVFAAGPEEWNE